MPAFSHLEIWDNYRCAGGVLVARVPDLMQCVTTLDTTGQDERLLLAVPRGSPSLVYLTAPYIARVVRSDGSWREWRVAAGTTTSGRASELVTRIGRSPRRELARGLLSSTDQTTGVTTFAFNLVNLTITEILTAYCLPALTDAGYPFWEVGTIDFTDPIDQLQVDWQSPLQVIQAMVDHFHGELGIRDHGTTGKYIDIVAAVGSGGTPVQVRTRKNLVSNAVTFETVNQATRVFPRGAKSVTAPDYTSISRIVAQVTAGGGPTVTIADPAGQVDLVAFDGEFTGWYAVRKLTGRVMQILNCSAANQTLSLDYDGVQNGEWLEFRRTQYGIHTTPCMEHLSLHRYARVVTAGAIPTIDDISSGFSAYDWVATDHRRDDFMARFYTQVFSDPTASYNAGTQKWTVGAAPWAVQPGDLCFSVAGPPAAPPFNFLPTPLQEVVAVDPIANTIQVVPHYDCEGGPGTIGGPVILVVYRLYGQGQVNNSHAATNDLWLPGPITGMAPGDMVLFEMDAWGSFPTAIDHPVYVQDPPAGYGVIPVGLDRPDLHGELNVIPNPLMRTWSAPGAAPPDGWAISNGPIGVASYGRNATPAYIKFARGQNIAVTLYNPAAGYSSIVKSPVGRVNALDYLHFAVVSMKLSLYLAAFHGDIALVIQVISGDGSLEYARHYIYPSDTTSGADPSLIFAENQWIEIAISNISIETDRIGAHRDWAERIAAGDLCVMISPVLPGGGSPLVQAYVDAVALYHTPYDPGAGIFLEGSGCNALLDAAHQELNAAATPSEEYEISLVDFERLYGTPYPDDGLYVGAMIAIADGEQAVVTQQRLVRLETNEFDVSDTKVTLATRQRPLTTILAAGG